MRSQLPLFLLVAIVASQSACFATTAKLRVGPVVDLDGKLAVQSDLAFGFGLASSERSGVTGSLGVGTGSSNHVELTDTIEYHRLEEDHGWRAGVRADIGLVGDKTVASWLMGALLVPIKDRRSHSRGHEKGGFLDSGTMTSRWSLGFEARLGYRSRELAEKVIEGAPAFGAAATLEWHGFSRVH